MPETKAAAASRLSGFLQRVVVMRSDALANPARAQVVLSLKAWQAARLARTYPDLLASQRYRDAALFFLEELYGARDYSQRDGEVARILPKLTAMLPAAALSTIADAVELDALSEQMDLELVSHLDQTLPGALTEEAYARAYRQGANRPAREHQIALTRHIGDALDGLTRMPLLEGTLKLMRGPARLAGLGNLQSFLERGFGAFKRMRGAEPFLNAVETRETLLMNRLFAGMENPFAGLAELAIS